MYCLIKNRFSCLLALISLQTCRVCGQTDSIQDHLLEDIVITAQHVPTKESRALYKVHVINERAIQSKGANNLRELLLQELSINVTQRSVFGSSLEVQGVSKENIKILMDGVPVLGRLNGILDLNQISLINIQKVEFIQGPVSVIYGTDALGGVINLITKKVYNKPWNGKLSGYYESIGAIAFDGTAALQKINDAIRISAGLYKFNGANTTSSARLLNWEPRLQNNFSIQYSKKIRSLDLLCVSSYFNEKLNSLGDTITSKSGVKSITDVDYLTKRITGMINLRGELFSQWHIDGMLDYQYVDRFHDNYEVNLINGNKEISTKDPREENIEKFYQWHSRSQLVKNFYANKLSWLAGIEMQGEEARGARILMGSQSMNTYAFYQITQFALSKKMDGQFALRYSYNNAYGAAVIPSFQCKFTFENAGVLRAMLSKGFRSPGLKELYLDFKVAAGPTVYHIVGNEKLKPESSQHANLVYTFSVSEHMTMEHNVFYNDLTNLIVLSDLVNNKRNYINIDQFSSWGYNVKFDWRPASNLNLSLLAGITGRFNKLSLDYGIRKFSNTPDAAASITYELPAIKLRTSLYYKYNGESVGFILQNNAVNEVFREDFHNLSLSIGKKFLLDKFEFSCGIKNLMDVQNINSFNESGSAHSTDMQLWGRSFYLKTNYQF